MQSQINNFKVDAKKRLFSCLSICMFKAIIFFLTVTNEVLDLLLMFLEADTCNSLNSNQNVKDGIMTYSREASSTTGGSIFPS